MKYLLFLLPFISSFSFSQEKRISAKMISSKINSHLLSSYPTVKKFHFYTEIIAQVPYIECEFKYENDHYSLLFLNDSLIEVEVEVPFSEIPEIERLKISNRLNNDFESYKIIECQKVNQFSNVKYEITLQVKRKGKFEYYFNSLGEFIEREEETEIPIQTQF